MPSSIRIPCKYSIFLHINCNSYVFKRWPCNSNKTWHFSCNKQRSFRLDNVWRFIYCASSCVNVYKVISYKIYWNVILKCADILIWPIINLFLTQTAYANYCTWLLHTIKIQRCSTSRRFSVQILWICWCFHAYQSLIMKIM